MTSNDGFPHDVLPLLSRGKHRRPRDGACFMELASLLAGERWSDNPACTHPLLSKVARDVNDRTSDSARQRLAVLVPSVINLTSDDPRVDVRIAHRCATLALPMVAERPRRVMAMAVRACEGMLTEPVGRPPVFRRQVARVICHVAVASIARAHVPNRDAVLRDLLAAAIDECWAATGNGSRLKGTQADARGLDIEDVAVDT